MAGPADAPTVFTESRIGFVKGMTVGAMGFRCIGTLKRGTSQRVLAMCHRLKVIWSHTSSIPAQVVEFNRRGQWSVNQFVRKAMGLDEPSRTIGRRAKPKNSVTTTLARSHRSAPIPTGVSVALGDVQPKAFLVCGFPWPASHVGGY